MSQEKLDIVVELTDRASSGLKSIERQVSSLSSGVKTFGREFGLMGGAILTATGFVAKSLFEQAAAFEQSQVAFETMLGSVEAGSKLLQEIGDFAATTPFTLPGIEESTKMLLAMGIESENILPTLKSLGDVSAGLSVPIERIALAYGQVSAANQLYGTELRQFVNNGVPLLAVLAEQFGTTESAVKEMVEDGLVSFADVEEAFRSMSGEGGTFFNLMDKQSQTFNGQLSNLQDNISLLAREFDPLVQIGTKALMELNKVLTNVTDRIREVGLKQFFEENRTVIMVFAGLIGGLLLGSLIAVIAAFISFAGTALAIAAAIGAAGAAIGFFIAKIIEGWPAVKLLASIIKGAFGSALDIIREKMTQAGEFLKSILDKIKSFFVAFWEGIKFIFTFWAAFVVGLAITAFEMMGIDIVAVFQSMAAFIQSWWEDFKTTFALAIEALSFLWTTFLESIVSVYSKYWGAITAVASAIWGALQNLFSSKGDEMESEWTGRWQAMSDIVSGVWETIKGTVKASLNWIIEKINAFIRKANEIASKASVIPGVSVPQLPEIPMLAQGGIVTKPTLAMVGEGGESEAVVPLSRAAEMGFGAGRGLELHLHMSDSVVTTSDTVMELIGDPLMREFKKHFAVA